jgi:hypothetical protein
MGWAYEDPAFMQLKKARNTTAGTDDLSEYFMSKVRLAHAERLQVFVGSSQEEQDVNLCDARLCGDASKDLVDMHNSAKGLVARIPQLQSR